MPQVESEKVDWLIDWIDFNAVSAIFQPCNGGELEKEILVRYFVIRSYDEYKLKPFGVKQSRAASWRRMFKYTWRLSPCCIPFVQMFQIVSLSHFCSFSSPADGRDFHLVSIEDVSNEVDIIYMWRTM